MDKATNPNHRYAALDGLRGFAAISVVLFHIGHWLSYPGLATNSGLAVDLFFCLSGFVLPAAYERRFQADLSALRFFKIRLIRLMPMIVLGTLLSAPYVLARSHVLNEPISTQELVLATVLGVTNLPFIWASTAIGGPQVFPLNGPQYSLFLEIVVNVLWSAIRGVDRLWIFGLIFAVSLVAILIVGMGGDDAATFWSGFPRVGASFFAGVLVFHIDKKLPARIPPQPVFWLLSSAMVLLFYYPEELPFYVHFIWLALLTPVLIYSGSKVQLSGNVRSLALFGGELSYPIYALHYPIFCWFNGIYQALTHQRDVIVVGPLVFVAVLIGSWLALKTIDIPVRNWLGRSSFARSSGLIAR